ncbi:actin-related protein 8-like [Eurytemora carolleeae]|uniref:actin-related protein 8-like n=1 Tax=Eurytemora carolleeae TaxID=1294199 RepID=UPI000C760E76|nr:actin-related protein 8-like [Eurytemora carolleeae]|eukprot:XP_023347662.1 actin-related protein 8-like [Eurytemora affinis]
MDELVNEKTIVLHPGSLYLRIGTESPITSLHCIARRRKPGGGIYNEIESLQALRSKRSGWEGGKTSSSGSEQSQDVLNMNLVNNVEIYDEPAPQPSHQDVIVGDATLKCDLSQYNLHFPYKGGELNLHPGIGGSLTSVLSDLAIIWSNAISQGLGIDTSQFPNYKIILLIPSVYKRNHIKHLMHLLLGQLNFQAAFPLQEDVAATFGTGHAAACVVDLGQRNNLSVENGCPYRRDYSNLPDYILTQNIKVI